MGVYNAEPELNKGGGAAVVDRTNVCVFIHNVVGLSILDDLSDTCAPSRSLHRRVKTPACSHTRALRSFRTMLTRMVWRRNKCNLRHRSIGHHRRIMECTLSCSCAARPPTYFLNLMYERHSFVAQGHHSQGLSTCTASLRMALDCCEKSLPHSLVSIRETTFPPHAA